VTVRLGKGGGGEPLYLREVKIRYQWGTFTDWATDRYVASAIIAVADDQQ
jgi:hypothetical protein